MTKVIRNKDGGKNTQNDTGNRKTKKSGQQTAKTKKKNYTPKDKQTDRQRKDRDRDREGRCGIHYRAVDLPGSGDQYECVCGMCWRQVVGSGWVG